MAVPVELGIAGSLGSWPLLVFVVGLFTAIILMVRGVKGAILIAHRHGDVLAFIVELVGNIGSKTDETGAVVNPAGWALDVPSWPEAWDLRDARLLARRPVLPLGSIESIGIVAVLLLVFSLLLADFFDTMGTMVAVGSEAKLLDKDGNPIGTQKILVVDSVAALVDGPAAGRSGAAVVQVTPVSPATKPAPKPPNSDWIDRDRRRPGRRRWSHRWCRPDRGRESRSSGRSPSPLCSCRYPCGAGRVTLRQQALHGVLRHAHRIGENAQRSVNAMRFCFGTDMQVVSGVVARAS